MTAFFKSIVVAALGVALGLGATWISLEHGFLFGAVHSGAWTAWPSAGSVEVDPYSKAMIARSGVLPVGKSEGVAFFAEADSDGGPLNARCDYQIEGTDPPARFWTLGVFDRRGALVQNAANRYGLDSQDILRFDQGRLRIAVSARPQSGNWIPSPGDGPYTLVFTLYESNLDAGAAMSGEAILPIVRRGTCR